MTLIVVTEESLKGPNSPAELLPSQGPQPPQAPCAHFPKSGLEPLGVLATKSPEGEEDAICPGVGDDSPWFLGSH